MDVLDKIKTVRDLVKVYFDENSEFTGLSGIREPEKNHIIEIGTSILCTKWNVGYEGGGFVQAVVNNDLMGAVGKADGTNVKMLPFYCKLIYNTSLPMELQQTK